MMDVKQQANLQDLRVLELSILLQHLRLGKAHLQKHLSGKQFAELMKFDGLNGEQRDKIYASHAEKSGSFALALNTVFTCAVGSWLGTTGFIGIGVGSPHLLITLTSIVAIISAYLGYYNYNNNKNKVKESLINQKLHNIQLNIIKIINQKRRTHIQRDIDFLNNTLATLQKTENQAIPESISKNNFDSKEDIFNWLNLLNSTLEQKAKALSQEAIYDIYIDELTDSQAQLKKLLSSNITIKEESADNTNATSAQTIWQPYERTEHSSFIEVLTDPTIVAPKYLPKKRSWFRNNFLSLLVGFLPTILGGFGSMFVYFGGIPDILEAFGVHSFKAVASHPLVKPVELLIAIVITLYFGYTFARNNHKNFQREQELDKTQKKIINEEALMIEVNAKLNFLRKLKLQINRIAHLFKVLKRLSTNLREKQQQLDDYMQKYLALEKRIAVLQDRLNLTSDVK